MDKNEALIIARNFALLIKSQFNPTKVFLFGSYANNTNKENSDIDVAVVVKNLEGEYLSNLKLLYKLRKQIDLSIEPVLFIEDQDPSGFLEFIEKNGIVAFSE